MRNERHVVVPACDRPVEVLSARDVMRHVVSSPVTP